VILCYRLVSVERKDFPWTLKILPTAFLERKSVDLPLEMLEIANKV